MCVYIYYYYLFFLINQPAKSCGATVGGCLKCIALLVSEIRYWGHHMQRYKEETAVSMFTWAGGHRDLSETEFVLPSTISMGSLAPPWVNISRR